MRYQGFQGGRKGFVKEPYTIPGRQDDATAIRISSYFPRFFFHFRRPTDDSPGERSLSMGSFRPADRRRDLPSWHLNESSN